MKIWKYIFFFGFDIGRKNKMSKLFKSAFACCLRLSSAHLPFANVLLKRPLQRQILKWSAGQSAYYVTSRGSPGAVKWSTRDYRAGRRESSPAARPLASDFTNELNDEYSDEVCMLNFALSVMMQLGCNADASSDEELVLCLVHIILILSLLGLHYVNSWQYNWCAWFLYR